MNNIWQNKYNSYLIIVFTPEDCRWGVTRHLAAKRHPSSDPDNLVFRGDNEWRVGWREYKTHQLLNRT